MTEEGKLLPVLVDRLPPFSGYWPPARIDLWFRWFFELLDTAQAEQRKAAPREAVAGDFGLDTRTPLETPR